MRLLFDTHIFTGRCMSGAGFLPEPGVIHGERFYFICVGWECDQGPSRQNKGDLLQLTEHIEASGSRSYRCFPGMPSLLLTAALPHRPIRPFADRQVSASRCTSSLRSSPEAVQRTGHSGLNRSAAHKRLRHGSPLRGGSVRNGASLTGIRWSQCGTGSIGIRRVKITRADNGLFYEYRLRKGISFAACLLFRRIPGLPAPVQRSLPELIAAQWISGEIWPEKAPALLQTPRHGFDTPSMRRLAGEMRWLRADVEPGLKC